MLYNATHTTTGVDHARTEVVGMDRTLYIGMNRMRAWQLHRDLGLALAQEGEGDHTPTDPFELVFNATFEQNTPIEVTISNDDMENRDDVTDNTVFVQIS